MKPIVASVILWSLCAILFPVAAQQLQDGEYYIKVNATGKYLAIEGISQENSARLVQWDFVNQPNHKFIVKRYSDQRLGVYYTLQPVHSGKYVSVEGKTTRGAKIIQYDWANQDNQRWYIDPDKNGWQIKSVEHQYRISVSGFNAATYTPGNGAYFIINNDERPLYFEFRSTSAVRPNSTNASEIRNVPN